LASVTGHFGHREDTDIDVAQHGIPRGGCPRQLSVATDRNLPNCALQAVCDADEGTSLMKADNKHNAAPHNGCAARPGYGVDLEV